MAANKLKIKKKEALSKLDIQIVKGIALVRKYKDFLKEVNKRSIRVFEIDKCKVEINQWVSITQSILYEIYHSNKYSDEFGKLIASDTGYHYPSWKPNIAWYIMKLLVPKIEYLRILKENTKDFDEIEKGHLDPIIKNEKQKTKEEVTKIDGLDLNKIPFKQLYSVITGPQIWKIVTSSAGALAFAFYIGFYFGGNESMRNNNDLKKDVNVLSKDVETLGTQNDSLKHIIEDLNSGKKSDGDL